MTAAPRLPVLWLCGPAGVGKSTVSWQLYTELAGTGLRVAFADSDQLCMCYPAPPGDPGRQHVKALNAGALVASLRAAGARCLIINGVLDPSGLETDLLPDAKVTICRLRADREEIRRRFAGKGEHWDDLDRMLREIDDEIRQMDQSTFADACVDTTDVPAAEVAARVRAACADWPGFTGDLPCTAGQFAVTSHPLAGGRVALITGPTGVGKSTIGFRFYLDCLNAGLTAGFVDLRQIGFLRPADESDPDHHRLKARNLAAIWRNYQAAGASHLVAAGAIDDRAGVRWYTDELAGAALTVVRLRADRDELMRRVMTRGAGGSWPEPGDPLRGRSAGYLAGFARQAARDADAADRSAPGGPDGADGPGDPAINVIDTTGCSPDESAALIAATAGWFDR